MADDDFFTMQPFGEAPPPVPNNAPILLGAPDQSSSYVGDVDETPPPDDNPYQVFGEAPTASDDDNPYQVFGEPPAVSDNDFGFAAPSDAPIILGPPDGAVFGDAAPSVEDAADEEEPAPAPYEPSPMQKWNEEFQDLLNQRREAENTKRAEQVEAARAAMEQFHATRDARREARMSKNRQDEQAKLEAIEADLENDNSWQRVCKMVELTHDSTKEAADLKRMRDVLIHLKNDTVRAQKLS